MWTNPSIISVTAMPVGNCICRYQSEKAGTVIRNKILKVDSNRPYPTLPNILTRPNMFPRGAGGAGQDRAGQGRATLCGFIIMLCPFVISLCGFIIMSCQFVISLCGYIIILCPFIILLSGFILLLCQLVISLCEFIIMLCRFFVSLCKFVIMLCQCFIMFCDCIISLWQFVFTLYQFFSFRYVGL